MHASDLLIRSMRREELDVLVDWAAAEGWNPGLHDAGIFWTTDPGGFIAAKVELPKPEEKLFLDRSWHRASLLDNGRQQTSSHGIP